MLYIREERIDWLTVTTWDARVEGLLMSLVGQEGRKVAKVMQYDGIACGSVFCGLASQRGKKHWMFRAGGDAAHILYPTLADIHYRTAKLKATRVDVQVTVEWPHALQLYMVRDDMKALGCNRKLVLIESSDGFDTLYIGSRKSAKMWRLYKKEDRSGRQYLRCEMEYKRDVAQRVFERGLPVLFFDARELPDAVGQEILPYLSWTMPVVRGKTVSNKNRTFEWLLEQVEPAIMRLAFDDDIGPEAYDLVRSWLAEIEKGYTLRDSRSAT